MRAVGRPLVAGQLLVQTGDLLLADVDGVVKIPLDIAADTLQKAGEIRTWERSHFDMINSPDFTFEKWKNREKDA